jgi:hypothetical protein
MPTASSSPRAPLTDSPWYWLYLFATAGLIALVLLGPKFSARQAQLERNYQGHQRANQNRVGLAPDTPLSSRDDTYIRLWPLYVLLFTLLAVGWIGLWWRRHHRPAEARTALSVLEEFPAKPTQECSDHIHVRNSN